MAITLSTTLKSTAAEGFILKVDQIACEVEQVTGGLVSERVKITLQQKLENIATAIAALTNKQINASEIKYTTTDGEETTVAEYLNGLVNTTPEETPGTGETPTPIEDISAEKVKYVDSAGNEKTLKQILDDLGDINKAKEYALSASAASTLALNVYQNSQKFVQELSTSKNEALEDIENKSKDILNVLEQKAQDLNSTKEIANKLAAAFDSDAESPNTSKFAIIGQDAYDKLVQDQTIDIDKIYFVFDNSDEESNFARVTVSSSNDSYGHVIGSGVYDITSETATIVATPKEGYEFKGWYLSDDNNKTIRNTNAYWNFAVSQNVSYTALFEKSISYCQLTVATDDAAAGRVYIVDLENDSNVTTYSKKVPVGTQQRLIATLNEGYQFLGWTKNNETEIINEDLTINTTVSTDIAYIAHYVKTNQLKLTVVSDPIDAGNVIGTGIYFTNDYATISATSKNTDWYEFNKWVDSQGTMISNENPYTYKVTQANMLTAKFNTIVDFVVNPEADNVNVITLNPIEALASDTTTTINYTGYAISKSNPENQITYQLEEIITFGINTSVESVEKTGSVEWHGNTINWIVNQSGVPTYNLNIISEHGTVTKSLEKDAYVSGDTVTLTATPDDGYEFNHWIINEETSNECVITFDSSDVSVTAVYNQTKFTVSVTPSTNGSVTPDKTFVTPGESVTLTITPEPTYELTELVITKVSDNSEIGYSEGFIFVMPESDVTISATFSEVSTT